MDKTKDIQNVVACECGGIVFHEEEVSILQNNDLNRYIKAHSFRLWRCTSCGKFIEHDQRSIGRQLTPGARVANFLLELLGGSVSVSEKEVDLAPMTGKGSLYKRFKGSIMNPNG